MAKDKSAEFTYKEEGLRRSKLRKEKRKLKMGSYSTCSHCRRDFGRYIHKVINPYYEEINGIVVRERLCEGCYSDIMGDI